MRLDHVCDAAGDIEDEHPSRSDASFFPLWDKALKRARGKEASFSYMSRQAGACNVGPGCAFPAFLFGKTFRHVAEVKLPILLFGKISLAAPR